MKLGKYNHEAKAKKTTLIDNGNLLKNLNIRDQYYKTL